MEFSDKKSKKNMYSWLTRLSHDEEDLQNYELVPHPCHLVHRAPHDL